MALIKFHLQCLKTDDPLMYNSITENSVEGLDLFFVVSDYDSSHRPKFVLFCSHISQFHYHLIGRSATAEDGSIYSCDR